MIAMADLVSPAGTRVTVSDELAERMLARGWRPVDAAPVKRKPGRPKKSDTAE